MGAILSSPEVVGLITSILGLALGWFARHKGMGGGTPTPPQPPALPNIPSIPGVPSIPGLEPMDLLRVVLEAIRKRRQNAKAEEDVMAKIGELFPDK